MIYNNKMKKNVVFVWDQNPFNVRDDEGWDNPNGSYWGIGDIIRGILTTYAVCQKYNYNFYIDFQKHPISKLLVDNHHPFYKEVKNNNKITFVWKESIDKYMSQHPDDLIMIMNCQKYQMNQINLENEDQNILNYLSKIFTPTPVFLKKMIHMKENYQVPSNYHILHFRLGQCEKKNNNIDNILLQKCINIYLKYQNNRIVIISDSMILKNELKRFNAKMIPFSNISHLGYQNDLPLVENTLIEFFLLINAKSIITFSKFGWISGFAKYAAIIKNVPLFQIK